MVALRITATATRIAAPRIADHCSAATCAALALLPVDCL